MFLVLMEEGTFVMTKATWNAVRTLVLAFAWLKNSDRSSICFRYLKFISEANLTLIHITCFDGRTMFNNYNVDEFEFGEGFHCS